MKIYLVGGAVRDKLLGIKPKDKDYVVVGSTPEEMLNLGYKQVGNDFPVFLHPETGEEYALARTEVKNGVGYEGFDMHFGPEVTLEQDLARRDLTINSMAEDLETGQIIDPFNGQFDLRAGFLHPTSDAFFEDPLRMLRVARFAARYPAMDLSALMAKYLIRIVESGELANLTVERVWQETESAMSEEKPSRYFEILNGSGLFPELENMVGVEEDDKWHPEKDVFTHIMMVIDEIAKSNPGDPLAVFGGLVHDFGKPTSYAKFGSGKMHEHYGIDLIDGFCDKWKTPLEYRKFGKIVSRYHTNCHRAYELNPKTIHKMLGAIGSKFLPRFLDVCRGDKNGRGGDKSSEPYFQPAYLWRCDFANNMIDRKAITEGAAPGPDVGHKLRMAGIRAIAAVDKPDPEKGYDSYNIHS